MPVGNDGIDLTSLERLTEQRGRAELELYGIRQCQPLIPGNLRQQDPALAVGPASDTNAAADQIGNRPNIGFTGNHHVTNL